MPTRVRSGALAGIEGIVITAEVDVARGLPGFRLVGLPGAEVRESRQRVAAALRNSGLALPPGRITVNLAPADLRKEGAAFDLAIALGVLAASGARGAGALERRHADTVFLGELSLFGEIRPARGVLPIVAAARRAGCRAAVVPAGQEAEAALVEGIEVHGAASLAQVAAWLRGEGTLAAPPTAGLGSAPSLPDADAADAADALAALAGQALARKAAVIAAAGRHNLLMVGPPGSGKTRLARLLGRLQPALAGQEALEVTAIHSAAGLLPAADLVRLRPFRAPHHTTTPTGLVGGGAGLRPGEATLAHRGILFLDELAEFPAATLDVLREPLEEGTVSLARAAGRRRYPAAFQLVAATNPCRCGGLVAGAAACRCSPAERRRYLGRLSGPLLDRFDLFVEVGAWAGPLPMCGGGAPAGGAAGSGWRDGPSPELLAAVQERWRSGGPDLAPAAGRRLQERAAAFGLSLRGADRCRRVAGTIALLDGAAEIGPGHVDEALAFRPGAAFEGWLGPGA
jgi:magnesium chelatase family protein